MAEPFHTSDAIDIPPCMCSVSRFTGSFAVVDKGGRPYVKVAVENDPKRMFSPEEVSAMILSKMKETAEVRR